MDRHDFTLTADAKVVFDSITNDANLNWSLVGPHGAIVNERNFAASDSASLGGNPVIGLTSGDYTISVDGNQGATGGYGFRLFDLQAAQDIVAGTSTTGQISPANETDAYRFDATAGDHFYLDLTGRSGGDVTWQVLDPSGQQVIGPTTMNSASQDVDLPSLAATGTYTLLVEGQIDAVGTADYTPYLNEEYLATSTPNEWIAKPGSEAAGKMDLLSVLLHEYGHALGIDHSADPHDFMGTTLAPGVRRLPSADELALMAKLVAEAKGDLPLPADPAMPDQPGAPLPNRNGTVRVARARITREGTFVDSFDNADTPASQYEVAANPTLADPKLQSGTGWETTGKVSIGNVDGNALALTLAKPDHGTLSQNADGTYTYTPRRGYTGIDGFSYTVSDGSLSATGRIAIDVVRDDHNHHHHHHDHHHHRGDDDHGACIVVRSIDPNAAPVRID